MRTIESLSATLLVCLFPVIAGCGSSSTDSPSEETTCGDMTVDLQTDASHCGSCETACAADQACNQGVCEAIRCDPPLTLCGTRCAPADECHPCSRDSNCAEDEECADPDYDGLGSCVPAMVITDPEEFRHAVDDGISANCHVCWLEDEYSNEATCVEAESVPSSITSDALATCAANIPTLRPDVDWTNWLTCLTRIEREWAACTRAIRTTCYGEVDGHDEEYCQDLVLNRVDRCDDDLLEQEEPYECLELPNGAECTSDWQCLSYYCHEIDHVCADESDRPIDSDGDDVYDAQDNCPSVPNPGQDDTDSDGIGDACDDGAVTAGPDPVCTGDNDPGLEGEVVWTVTGMLFPSQDDIEMPGYDLDDMSTAAGTPGEGAGCGIEDFDGGIDNGFAYLRGVLDAAATAGGADDFNQVIADSITGGDLAFTMTVQGYNGAGDDACVSVSMYTGDFGAAATEVLGRVDAGVLTAHLGELGLTLPFSDGVSASFTVYGGELTFDLDTHSGQIGGFADRGETSYSSETVSSLPSGALDWALADAVGALGNPDSLSDSTIDSALGAASDMEASTGDACAAVSLGFAISAEPSP